MKQRNPLAVFLLPIVTFGIYSWYWLVKTKGEMNKLGQDIPTAWIWLIPMVGGVWWMWKYSEGVENISNGKLSGVLAFILLFLLGNIGQAIIQDTFNNIGEAATTAPMGAAAQPLAAQPQNDFQQPVSQPEVPFDQPVDNSQVPEANDNVEPNKFE